MRRFIVTHACVAYAAAFLLTACGGGGSAPPTVSINVSPSNIFTGQSATVSWSSTNASTCSASGAWSGSQPTSGTLAVSLAVSGTYAYALNCASSGSSAAVESATLTVTSPSLAIATATLASGVIGTSYSGTIQATGGVAPFVWTVGSGALPNGLSLNGTTSTATVSGVPQTVAQGVAFAIQVADSAHHVATQAYTVSILPHADTLLLSPASLDFGIGSVGGTSSALTETLSNNGTAPIVITSIVIAGANAADFNQTTACGAGLPAGASCAINVTFAPGQNGPRSAALSISDDTAGSPQSLSLSGVGVTAGPDATPSVSDLALGTQLVGTTSPALSVMLTNYGTGTLNISNIATTASFAEADNCVPSLASGATCAINVTFTPGASGDTTGTLSISDDAPGNPQNVSLSGTGSTSTPVLTGYCAYLIGDCTMGRTLSSDCPSGHPAEHPSELACIAPQRNLAPVDGGRPCTVPASTRVPHGFCETK